MVNGWVEIPAGCSKKKSNAMVQRAFRTEMRKKARASDQRWTIHAKVDGVPKGWTSVGTTAKPRFRCAVTKVVDNYGIRERVNAELEFTGIPMTEGRNLLTGCRMKVGKSVEPLDSGHEIVVSVLNDACDEFELGEVE